MFYTLPNDPFIRMDKSDRPYTIDSNGFIRLDVRAGFTTCTPGKTIPCGRVCRTPANCKKGSKDEPHAVTQEKPRSVPAKPAQQQYSEHPIFDLMTQKAEIKDGESRSEARNRHREQQSNTIKQMESSAKSVDVEALGIPESWRSQKATNQERQDFMNNLVGSNSARKLWATDAGRLKQSKAQSGNPPYPEEIMALKLYTSNDYGAMNAALRSISGDRYNDFVNPNMASGRDTERIKGDALLGAKVATSALNSLPNYEGTVFRGMKTDKSLSMADVEKMYKPGNSITEQGFTSTSRDTDESFGSRDGYDVQFVINSKTGKSIEQFSETQSEKEVLFRPSTSFNVLKHERKNGKLVIYMDEQ